MLNIDSTTNMAGSKPSGKPVSLAQQVSGSRRPSFVQVDSHLKQGTPPCSLEAEASRSFTPPLLEASEWSFNRSLMALN